MQIEPLNMPGVFVVQTQTFSDQRGQFYRCYEKQIYPLDIHQVNFSCTSTKGSVRGLHLQNHPYSEVKMVRCITGAIFDVIVDLRKNSPTFSQWLFRELTEENKELLIIPPGCAHGFQTLKNDSELLYLHSKNYQPSHEIGIHPLDSTINIKWPHTIHTLSERDNLLPNFSEFIDKYEM